MFRLIKNVEVYSPKFLGAKDILFCNNKIVKIGNDINIDGFDCEVIDGTGKKLFQDILTSISISLVVVEKEVLKLEFLKLHYLK